MNAPIFIVGANRSGTTLLRLLLNAHPDVAIPDELNYFYGFDWRWSYSRWRSPSRHSHAPMSAAEYRAFVDRFLSTNADAVPDIDLPAVRRAILTSPMDLRSPYRTLLEAWAKRQGKSRWGEKTPGNIFHAGILVDMFPEAKFIHVVRDPRGGVASMQGVSFFSTDAVFNALNRHRVMTEGRTSFERAVPPEQRMEIRYEDLVRDPHALLQSVCSFLELPFEERMLRFYEDADDYMVEAAASSYNEAATQPISSSRAEKWKDSLTDDQVAAIQIICGAELREFGYERLPVRLSIRGSIDFAIKWLYWKGQRWRHSKDPLFAVVTPMFAGLRSRLRRFRRRLADRLFPARS